MESAQRDLIDTLLGNLLSLGLLSQFTCSRAMELARSGMDFPVFFQYPEHWKMEESDCKHAQ